METPAPQPTASTTIELPHTAGCLVCGRQNPYGLHLSLRVDPATGVITTEITPRIQHIGFDGIVHGGLLATVLDEAMVWAATWHGRRFCLCGEMTVRFRQSAMVGQPLIVKAKIDFARPTMIQAAGDVRTVSGGIVAASSGKYVPLPVDRNAQVLETLVAEPSTAQAAQLLKRS